MDRVRPRSDDGKHSKKNATMGHSYPRECSMDYDTWERSVPADIQQDPLWSLRVYRTALYAGDLGRQDAERLSSRSALGDLPDQLARATRSISVNISEGYCRLSRRDRGRFYEYALGSARESRDWYFHARESLGLDATTARLALHTTIIRIMTVLTAQCKPPRDTARHE
jgi:four helix bundle protein